jgi:hypothetical protein
MGSKVLRKIVSRKLMGDTAYANGRAYGGYMEVYVQEDELGTAGVVIDLKMDSGRTDKHGLLVGPERVLEKRKIQRLSIGPSALPTFVMIMKMALAEVEAKNAKPIRALDLK